MTEGDPAQPPAPLVVLTDRLQCRAGGLVDVVAAAIEGGARWFVFREKDLGMRERADLYEAVMKVARGRARVSVAGGGIPGCPPPWGLHLGATDGLPYGNRRPPLLGRSCHSLDELQQAGDEGLSYAIASPVFATASKPGYGPTVGLDALHQWCAAVAMPVFALGGITAANAGDCRSAGAEGIAVMGEVMRADDPARVTADLVAAGHSTPTAPPCAAATRTAPGGAVTRATAPDPADVGRPFAGADRPAPTGDLA